jgi:glycerol-3-phosphate dehydrogenase (NAD(P)+)
MNNFEHFAVYGGGSWGTALACNVARRHKKVELFLRDQQIINEILHYNTNTKYLGNILLPSNIHPSNDLPSALAQEVIIIAIPSTAFSDTINILKEARLPPNTVLLIATKGLCSNPTRLLSEQVKSILPNPIAFIAGPNFAKEVAGNFLTPVTIASEDLSLAQKLQASLITENFHITTTNDIITIQIAGVVKNIIAIASGLREARGCGENARAGLITQGLQEIMALSKVMGGQFDTLLSYGVVGDLVLTCHSRTSRNTKFGFELAKQQATTQFLQNYPYLVEGIEATKLIMDLIKKYNLDLPIISLVAQELRAL